MKVYIDDDYKCHVSNNGTMREFDVPFFDGKCDAFIEGYRYIPEGETWTNADGVECSGISPWQEHTVLEALQAVYEQGQENILLAVETALGVTSE